MSLAAYCLLLFGAEEPFSEAQTASKMLRIVILALENLCCVVYSNTS